MIRFTALVLIALGMEGCLPMPGSSEPKQPEISTKKSESVQKTSQEKASPTRQPQTSAGMQPSRQRTLLELRQNLKGSDPLKRAHALFSLAYFEDHDSVEQMKIALRDRNAAVQQAAIRALADMGLQEVVPMYYMLFGRSQNPEVKKAILRALQSIQDDRTVEFLTRILPRLEPQLASIAYETLQQVRPSREFFGSSGRVDLDSFSISGVMGQGVSARIQVDREFFGVGDELLGFTIQEIDPVAGLVKLQKDGQIYSKEIDAFSRDPAEKAVEDLNSADDEIVFQALMDLAYYQSITPVEELTALISGANSPRIQAAAIRVAGLLGVVEAIEPLREAMNRQRDPLVQQVGAVNLAMLGDENALDILEPLSQNQNPWVRNAVASALGILASQHGIATLVRLLGDTYSFVRNNAAEQLMMLGPVGFRNQILAMISSTYTADVSDETRSVLQTVIPYLQSLPGGDEGGGFQLSSTTVSDAPESSPEPPPYQPGFVLVSLGQFGTKAMANVRVNGEPLTVYTGEKLDGLEVVKIEPREEFLYLKLENGRFAVIELSYDEETLAPLYEVVDEL